MKAPAGNEETGHCTSARTSGVNASQIEWGRCDDYSPRIPTGAAWGGRTSIGGNVSPWLGALRETAETVR